VRKPFKKQDMVDMAFRNVEYAKFFTERYLREIRISKRTAKFNKRPFVV